MVNQRTNLGQLGMLWTTAKTYREDPFEHESDLEDAILQVAPSLFGETRIYLDAKRKIGTRGRTRNIPDGYLCGIGPCGVPRPSLADYVIGTGATRGATAAGTC